MISPNQQVEDDRRIVGYDDFGFAIFNRGNPVDNERNHSYTERQYSQEEILSWEKVFNNWQDITNKWMSKLGTYIQRGVPRTVRPELWKRLLEVDTLRAYTKFNYQTQVIVVREQLVELGVSEFGCGRSAYELAEVETNQYRVKFGQVSLEALRHIFLDLDRSYPTHCQFMGQHADGKEGRASLFRVLAVYARYNPSVEYCQGMGSIAGMFLMQLEEEDAFWCLVSLLERHKYLAGYFEDSMHRLQKHADVFNKLLKQRRPKLCQHLEDLGIHPLMYVTPWFMCLFTGMLCWDTVLSIWDILLLDGHKTVFRVGLALMEVFEEDLLCLSDIALVLPRLLRPPHSVLNHKRLMPVIWSTMIEDWEVNSLLAILHEPPCTPGTPSSERKRKLQTASPVNIRLARRGQNTETVEKPDSPLFEFQGPDAHPHKRPRITKESPSPGILRRVLNLFAPKTEAGVSPQSRWYRRTRQSASKAKKSTQESVTPTKSQGWDFTGTEKCSAAHETRLMVTGAENTSQFMMTPEPANRNPNASPSSEAKENNYLSSRRMNKTPIRRSPRLIQQRALKTLNLPAPDNSLLYNLQKTAVSKHAFHCFNTHTMNTPQAQRPHILPHPAAALLSPDMEMKDLSMK